MKKILLAILIFNVISCNSTKKEKIDKTIVDYSCECISKIPENDNNAELVTEIQKCIADGYEKHAEYIDGLANKYFDKNPNADVIDAQNWIRKVVTEKLVKKCPRYSSIVSEIAFEKRNSSDIVKEIANNVCKEINELNTTELSWDKIDPIFIRQYAKNEDAINERYNLNDKAGMKKYSTDLVQELVVNCEKYKQFTLGIKK